MAAGGAFLTLFWEAPALPVMGTYALSIAVCLRRRCDGGRAPKLLLDELNTRTVLTRPSCRVSCSIGLLGDGVLDERAVPARDPALCLGHRDPLTRAAKRGGEATRNI